jgi:hypothetical protein
MYPSLLLSAALVAPAAPLPADANAGPAGPAPRVLALKADAGGTVRVVGNTPMKVTVTNTYFVIENNQQVQKQVEQDVLTSQYFNKTLAEYNAKFTTADGTPLTPEEAAARVKRGATVLASSDGKPVSKAWLRAAAPDTVVMVAEGFAHAQLSGGGEPLPATPAPQLALLGTDERGRVLAPCTSRPVNPNAGTYYGNVQFEGKAAFRGARIRNFDSGFYPQQVMDAKVVLKPLDEIKFDAYDRDGKLIPRSEVLKRLAAGGLVVVAGDNRMPDGTYLKGLRDDVMILAAPELVLPVAPIDQTKKKDPKKDHPAQPVPVAPAAKPAIIIQGGAVRRNAVVPAKQVEAKPAEKPVEKK